jgi:hypothetical protein
MNVLFLNSIKKNSLILFLFFGTYFQGNAVTYYAGNCPGPLTWSGFGAGAGVCPFWTGLGASGTHLIAQPVAGSILVIPLGCTVTITGVPTQITNNNISIQVNGVLRFAQSPAPPSILQFNGTGCNVTVSSTGTISSVGTSGASEITFSSGDKWQASNGSASGPFIINNNCLFKGGNTAVASNWTPSGCGITLLPIELLEFTGNCLTNGVQLNWSTALELNNDYFLIEKSSDGYQWEQIAKVKGLVNSYTHTKYIHVDYNTQNNLNYYRMSQVDLNGKTTIFKAIDVYCNEKNMKDQMVLYPNPSSTELNIILNVNNIANSTTISLVNNTGNVIFENKVDLIKGINSFTFPIDVLPGSYAILCSSDNVVIPAQKLMIINP